MVSHSPLYKQRFKRKKRSISNKEYPFHEQALDGCDDHDQRILTAAGIAEALVLKVSQKIHLLTWGHRGDTFTHTLYNGTGFMTQDTGELPAQPNTGHLSSPPPPHHHHHGPSLFFIIYTHPSGS